MNRTMRAGPLLLLLLATTAAGQLQIGDMPTARTTTVLPAKVSGADGLAIEGPSVADVGEYVHLEVIGLPPIDSSQTLDEALAWTRTIAMRVQQPPESESVDFDVTLGFRLMPALSWKLTLDLKADTSGDYAVAFAMPGVDSEAVQLATHGVRFGSGPVPPPPDPVIEVTPDGPFSSRGPPGGPFDPPMKGYLIENTGQGSVNWSANLSTPWLAASPATGTLTAGQSAEVFLSFGDAAKSLPAGFHAGVATISNETNGKGTTPRLVALTIEGEPPPPPYERVMLLIFYEEQDEHLYPQHVSEIIRTNRWDAMRGDKFREYIWDPDSAPPSLKAWVDKAKEMGFTTPMFVVVSEHGSVLYGPAMPESVDAAVDLVESYIPE